MSIQDYTLNFKTGSSTGDGEDFALTHPSRYDQADLVEVTCTKCTGEVSNSALLTNITV